MAKIRVYELARELNMKNKVLLEKLEGMDIAVRSHMSSLDDDMITKIKANLLDAKPDLVEVTRVNSTVVRRRKKRIKDEPVEVVVEEEPSEKLPEKEDLLKKEEIEEVSEDKVIQGKGVVEKVVEKVDKEKEELVPEKPVETTLEPPQEESVVPELKKPPTKPVVSEEAKPEKEKKKAKKNEAAKIIKLPLSEKKLEVSEREIARTKKQKTKKEAGPAKLVTESKLEAADPPVKEIKKKKRETKHEEPDHDKKFFKKKISFKRKEVVEAKELYGGKRKRIGKGKKGAKLKKSASAQPFQTTIPKAIKRKIKIDDAIVLSDLAKRMGIKAAEIIKKLISMGVMVTVNQTIDFDTAVIIASEFNYELEKASFEEKTVLAEEKDEPDKMIKRPPVVTIMGHVDHGKTSLLDTIRKTRVTENEAGGITQHIGAYNVSTDNGRIVFLDTPGHEAFTAMRARGAKVTDLVVLVVAADDGVMPQTIEAINHAKAGDVPIIVAVNKIDKVNADPERVFRELSEAGLVSEDWGGDTIFVKVSAKQNKGIDNLLEMILLQVEVLELKANPEKRARGHVIEAFLDKGRGAVATVLVHEGTLHVGDTVVCGIHYGKIRAMLNDVGVQIESAGPSIPVEILGLSGVPMAGDELIALSEEKEAKQVSVYRMQQQRANDLAKTSRLSLEKLFEQMQEGEVKDLNIIIKADVNGSIEAIRDSLLKLSNAEVNINVIHSATGAITESDISLAAVSDAIIIAFNVRPNPKIQGIAKEENVDIRFYNVIYNIFQDIEDAILGLMSSTFEEHVLGVADVREVFRIPKIGAIAGCYVTNGKIERGQSARVLRDGVVCYDGKISSLRRFKDDVKEVQTGYECGIGIEKYNDIKAGDTIECYYMEEIKPRFE